MNFQNAGVAIKAMVDREGRSRVPVSDRSAWATVYRSRVAGPAGRAYSRGRRTEPEVRIQGIKEGLVALIHILVKMN